MKVAERVDLKVLTIFAEINACGWQFVMEVNIDTSLVNNVQVT